MPLRTSNEGSRDAEGIGFLHVPLGFAAHTRASRSRFQAWTLACPTAIVARGSSFR
mgnify:CR=1 FL=1